MSVGYVRIDLLLRCVALRPSITLINNLINKRLFLSLFIMKMTNKLGVAVITILVHKIQAQVLIEECAARSKLDLQLFKMSVMS